MFFASLTCFFFPPYFHHDAFVHHAILVLDIPAGEVFFKSDMVI